MSSPATDLKIRPMLPADIDHVLQIERSLARAPHWPRAAYISALDPSSTPSRLALVASESTAGNPIAFAVASLLSSQAELEIIGVAPEHQRHGLARRLLIDLASEIRTRHCTEVILEVRASNHPALALYHQLGFIETARRLRYYADPIEDAILLALPLA